MPQPPRTTLVAEELLVFFKQTEHILSVPEQISHKTEILLNTSPRQRIQDLLV